MQGDQASDLQEVVVEVVLLLWVEVEEGHELKVGEVELGLHVLEEVEVVELHEGEEVVEQASLVLEVVEAVVHQVHKKEEVVVEVEHHAAEEEVVVVEHHAAEEEEVVVVEFDSSEKKKNFHT